MIDLNASSLFMIMQHYKSLVYETRCFTAFIIADKCHVLPTPIIPQDIGAFDFYPSPEETTS